MPISKRDQRKKTKLALIVLALVLGLLFTSWMVKLASGLFSPFRLSESIVKNYIWSGKFNINLLLRTNRLAIFSYNPKEEKITIINLPDELFLEVPGGFGSWQLRSIYDLDGSEGGGKLLVKTLMSSLAIPIDGFVDLGLFKKPSTALEIVDNLRKNPFSGAGLLSSLKTNLTLWELLQLKWAVGNVRFDKIKELDLDKFDILDQGNLADGSKVLLADYVKLDSFMAELADPTISSEHKSIAIFNATDLPGLAQKWSRIITNLGGNVIITANAPQTYEKTLVSGMDSKTLERLRQIFGISDKIEKGGEDSRAEINIFVGEDLAK